MAQLKANELGVPLATLKDSSALKEESYDKDLISDESGISYEYSDANRGICPGGSYKIQKNAVIRIA
jgi:hypothetical protein